MHAQNERSPRWSRRVGLLLAGLLGLSTSSPAHAFSYIPGDLVAIFVDGNTELIVNLGPVASLTVGSSFSFDTPVGFGTDGAIGARFVAYQTEAPFSGSLGRNVSFTVEQDVIPAGFNGEIIGYVNRLGLAQLALDDGGGAADKYLELLNNFPLPPTGGVITNTAGELSLLTTNSASYTSTIGVSGTSDRINNNLPFETDNPIGASTDVQLWRGVKVSNLLAQSTFFGNLRVEGNIAGIGQSPVTRITYIPEPESWVLLCTGVLGLAGLATARRLRRQHQS